MTMEHENRKRLTRRGFLGVGTATTLVLAGCLGDGDDGDDGDDTEETNDTDSPGDQNGDPPETLPVVENPPDEVYYPTHREAFRVLPTVEAGDYVVLPHFTYPHRFWLMRGGETEEVVPTVEDSMHLMLAVWDRETGQVLPVGDGTELVIEQDGEVVERLPPWPMVSQEMGFHFGDNVPLPGDGSYTVEVTLPPLDDTVRKTGAFEGRFTETVTATFDLDYSEQDRVALLEGVEFLDEELWGEPGALELMDHSDHDHGHGDDETHGDDHSDGHGGDDHDDGHGDHGDGDSHDNESAMPSLALPPADEYPGTDLGTSTSGGAAFVVRYVEDSHLSDGDEGYLLVSPRTPHNRIPLPDMALSITVGDGQELTQTLDHELGLHYGASVTLAPGEEFDLVVESPPQVARHQGYETAFVEMPLMTVEVPE